jgi:hypothetical protein
MIYIFRNPYGSGNRVAGFTVSRITCSCMIRGICIIIINGMTRKAISANRLEIQIIIPLVAALTIDTLMSTDKRESAKLMNLINIYYNPGVCGMASFAIRTDCVLMNIIMTGQAVTPGFGEDQGFMAGSAING